MEKELLLLAVGVCVGAMNAIAGGGMLIGFPAMVAFGVPPIVANATGAALTIPGHITAALAYRKYLRKVPLRYAILLIPCVLGAIAGATTLRHTPPGQFTQIVPWLVAFGVILFALQPFLHHHLQRHVKKRSRAVAPLIVMSLALLPITFYGGFFGPGYGFLLLAFLGFASIKDIHMMNAMKNISATFVAATSVVCLFSAHLINWKIGIIMATGCTIGGYLGAHYTQKISTHLLRIIIISIGLLAAIYLGFQQY